MARKRSRKHEPDMVHIVLSNRSSRVVSQGLPPYQEETEEIIAQKFVRVLNERFGRKCSKPTKNMDSNFPDCYCKEDGQSVGIELGQVTSEADAEHYQKGHDYSIAICQAIRQKPGNKLAALQGLHIKISLEDTDQELPPKSEGHQLSSSLAELLLSRLSDLQRLKLGHLLAIRWQGQTSRMSRSLRKRFLSNAQDHGQKSQMEAAWKKQSPYPLHLAMEAYRYALPSAASAPLIEFAPRGESPDKIRVQLKESVRKKIDIHYQPITGVKLLLLLYERFWLPRFADGEAVKLAQNELKASKHPFDEVWYFYPIAEDHKAPGKREGFLERLWPVDKG